MACPQAQELIDLVLINDPSVAAEARVTFDAHLEVCAACRTELEQSRRVVALVRQHGKLSLGTIQLLESQGADVPGHLRPEPEDEPFLSEGEIEAGLTRLMTQIDEMEAHGGAIEPKPMLLEEGVADLRRRVNTLEAHQTPRCKQWRRQWRDEPAADLSAAAQPPWRSPLRLTTSRWAHPFRERRWSTAAGLAAAACVALVAVLWSLWQPGGSDPISPQHVAHQADYSIELVTVFGHQPLALGEPIRSENDILELQLGGRHQVVLNRGTTATITAEPLDGRDDPAWHVDLAAGELYAEVVPDLPGGSRFAVATPHALATITGTKFNIRARDATTELTLLEGSVRFSSPATSEAVDVAAGHTSTVAARSAPTQPRQVDARLATAWARQALPDVNRQMVGQSLHDLTLLGDMRVAALVPHAPDYRTWTYERFRDETRPWFASQFLSAMKLEKTLNEQHGIEADYLDVLVISGNIWQFRYPEPRQLADRIPTFHLAAAERLTRWYGLDGELLLDAIGRYRPAESRRRSEDTGEEAVDAMRRWRTDLAAVTGREARGDLVLFSLRASAYLHHTRAAAYLWVREHPEDAERLLTSGGDYTLLFLTATLPPDKPESSLSLQDRLDDRLEACRQSDRLAQQWLTTSYKSDCSVDFMSPPRQLHRRLMSFAPHEQEDED